MGAGGGCWGWGDGPLGAQPAGSGAAGGRGTQVAPLLQRRLREGNAGPVHWSEAAAVLRHRHPGRDGRRDVAWAWRGFSVTLELRCWV